jgi:hypothetical protein
MTKQKRIYVKYKVKVGNKVVHGGITTDPARRLREHRIKWPTCHMIIIGRRVSKDSGLDWEADNGFQANCPN